MATKKAKADWNQLAGTDILTLPSPRDSNYTLDQVSIDQFMRGSAEDWDSLADESSSDSEYEYPDPSFFSIPVRKQDIHYFHTPEGIEVFLKHIKAAQIAHRLYTRRLDDYLVVTLVAKWKVLNKTREGVSILVVGLMDEIFILDILRLKSFANHSDEPWELLKTDFFFAPGVVKLGCCQEKLMNMLSKTHPKWENIREEFKLFVDLNTVAKRLIRKVKEFFPRSLSEIDTGYELSELIRISYGKPLNREALMSDWEQRPLSNKQLRHAAVDGYALTRILLYMQVRCRDKKTNLEDNVRHTMKTIFLPYPNFFGAALDEQLIPEILPSKPSKR